MKRLWLLVPLILLNVVMAVWGAERPYKVQTFDLTHGTSTYVVIGYSFEDKEAAEDLAEALNEAHERRMEETEQLCIQPKLDKNGYLTLGPCLTP